MLAYRSAGTLLPLKDDMDRRGNWEKHDEPIRVRRRNDGRDPPGGGSAATASSRDRVGILWLLYAVYESLVATGVLCDANYNIRVDLVFFFPILGLATFCAYQSYMGRPSPWKVVGIVLGVIGLVVFGLVAEGYGYGALTNVVTVGALAFGVVYAIKSRSNRS